MSVKQQLSITIAQAIGMLPLSWARALGSMVGCLMYLLKERNARNTANNIRACFPSYSEQEQNALVKSSLKNTGILALECLVIWRRDTAYLDEKILAIHGEDKVKSAIGRGRGLVILAPHLGNWEIVGKALPRYGPVTNLYQPPKRSTFENLIKTSREASGATLVPTNTRGVAALLKTLKQGHISGILPDQVPDLGSGTFADFFGLPAYTMKLIHKLHEKTDCAIILSFAERVKGGFELHFIEPDPQIYSADLSDSLSAMNTSIENAVMMAPAQYQWEYKRFKRRLENGHAPVDYAAKP